jgi:flagellar FliL protein
MSATAPAVAAPEALPAPATRKKKVILLIAIALVVLLVVGGGAAFYIMKKRAAAAAEDAAAEGGTVATAEAENKGHHSAPIYVPLELFVVNLADKDAERYAQVGLTLEVDDSKFADEMKLYMPAIRNSILMILAHKTSQELLERTGKEALAAEIMREAVRPMGIEIDPDSPAEGTPATKSASGARATQSNLRKPAVHNPVRRVHFASFIIQ